MHHYHYHQRETTSRKKERKKEEEEEEEAIVKKDFLSPATEQAYVRQSSQLTKTNIAHDTRGRRKKKPSETLMHLSNQPIHQNGFHCDLIRHIINKQQM